MQFRSLGLSLLFASAIGLAGCPGETATGSDPEPTPEVNPEGTPEQEPEGTPEQEPEGTPEPNPEGTPEPEPEGTDAGPVVDAGDPDGGAPTEDGGPSDEDAGTPTEDAGTPDDAGQPDTDGGLPAEDGGVPSDDGGLPVDGGPSGPLPDLSLTPQGFAPSVNVQERFFFDGSCQVENNCVGASGQRKLLDFSVLTKNIGDGDFRIGDPTTSDLFQTDVCSGQPVFREALRWEIVDENDAVVLSGLTGTTCIEDGAGLVNCQAQGLSVDEADLQPDGDACPFADVTDLPGGDYELVVTWDPLELIADADRTNNQQRTTFVHDGCNGTICGGICCPTDKCENDVCLLPDIFVDQETLSNTISISERTFSEASCAVFEGCVTGSGDRRLLRFSTETPNTGNADLFMGEPAGNDLFEFSECHNHYHFEEYASYRLINRDTGEVAARGHKQAFCLIDLSRYSPNAGPRQYNCGFQGISQGWSDIYSSGLDCQWVDITGVPGGTYILEVHVNPERIFEELNYENNITQVEVVIPPDGNACQPTPEVCGDGIDQDCDDVPDNGCEPLDGLDTCLDAADLVSSGLFTVDITESNTAAVDATCGDATGRDVFFRLITASDELVYLSTYGSEIDTTLTILDENCTAAGAIECSDDGCGQSGSHFAGTLAAGSYFVQVKAKNPADTGLVSLKVQRSFCSDATEIPATGAYSGDTSVDSIDDNRPEACNSGGSGADDLWWFTTCPGANNVSFSTCGADFDTMLEIREGTCAGSAAVTCNDDANGECGTQSQLSDSLESGVGEGDGMWFLLVDGYNTGAVGPYTIDATLP